MLRVLYNFHITIISHLQLKHKFLQFLVFGRMF